MSDLPNGVCDLNQSARRIFQEAMDECSIEHAFASTVETLHDGSDVLRFTTGETVDLSGVQKVLVIAIGKAASRMLTAFLQCSGIAERFNVEGILVAPEPPAPLPNGIRWFAGGHPTPNTQSFAAAQAAQQMLRTASESQPVAQTFCFFLISGGASAMMELPLAPQISLQDTIVVYRALVHSGATIAEINCVRKHFSAVKGGRLLRLLGKVRSLTIAVSDVPEGSLDSLGSGPTLPDSSTVADCRNILSRYDLLPQFPSSVRDFFASPLLTETPKPGDLPSSTFTLLSSSHLAAAACRSAERLGLRPIVDNSCDDWDFRDAAAYLLGRLRSQQSAGRTICIVSVGEITVKLPEIDGEQTQVAATNGVGGRNLHFAAYAALQIQPDERIAILSAGSDGVDGNSPAAGAVVDAKTVLVGRSILERCLADFNTYPILLQEGCAIVTGPTGTNVRDLRLLLLTVDQARKRTRL